MRQNPVFESEGEDDVAVEMSGTENAAPAHGETARDLRQANRELRRQVEELQRALQEHSRSQDVQSSGPQMSVFYSSRICSDRRVVIPRTKCGDTKHLRKKCPSSAEIRMTSTM
jgi:Sec-independent protein translocase protein TatA